MKRIKSLNSIQLSVLGFIVFIGIAHVFAYLSTDYNIFKNSISDLGAQQYRYAWIMRLGFLSFGASFGFGILKKIRQEKLAWPLALPLLAYAFPMAMVGVFDIKPFFATSGYSQAEDFWHSFFATSAGIAISLAVFSHPFPYRKERKKENAIDILAFFLVIGLSALFGVLESIDSGYVGLVQRAMWFVGLSWIFYIFRSKKIIKRF